ncbi:MAG: hypothetical protein ABIL39_10165, partial [candidate division WOR-3 bacterium]
PILCELARQLPVTVKFKTNLNRLWRFFGKSKFTLNDAYAGISPYFLEWLKRRQHLEILIDWIKLGRYNEQSPILAWVNFVILVKGDVWVRCGKFSGCLKKVWFRDRKILWWCKVCYQKKTMIHCIL